MSMGDAVGCLVTDILSEFENRAVTSAALCDLTFDCVDHALLLHNLEFNKNVGDNVKYLFINFFPIGTIKSFLKMNSLNLHGFVEFGVPQGLVLGPFLLLVMI